MSSAGRMPPSGDRPGTSGRAEGASNSGKAPGRGQGGNGGSGSQGGAQVAGAKRKAEDRSEMNAKDRKKARFRNATPQAQPVSASPAPSAGPSAEGAPRSVNLQEFINARAFEIDAMEKALTQSTEFTGVVRVFQSIPRHLRRRAASHNIKRLPVNHRGRALREKAKDPNPPKVVKPPPKRKRKSKLDRPAEFERRQKEFKWLETHVWHAKRFHMTAQWGLKIPLHSNQKAGRSTYRGAKTGCMMHDMSYMQLIELCGSREEVTKLAEALGDPSESAGIGAKVYTAGTRQGTTILYGYPSGFPTEPLGPALFLWDCFKSGEGQGAARERQLWIWVHPGSLSRVLESLEAARKVVGGNVTVKHLAGDVVRFRLMGPRSTLVLKSLLDVVDEGSKMELWKQITKLGVKADGLLEGSVVGLAVQDPRLSFPQKIRKGDNNGTDSDPPSKILTKLRGSWPLAASASDFWSAERRKQSKDARASEKKLNQRREANMVPGTRLKPLDSDPAIPILLVQRRGLSISGTPDKDVGGSEGSFGSGWDLLVPSGWGMSFWKSLAFLECRPIALKEVESLHFESNGLPFFPNDFVGNPICIDMAKARAEEAKALWERTPTGKRTNFADLGTDHPFLPPWEALVGIGDETMEVDGIATPWTLHSEKLLHHLERALVGKTPPESSEALLSSLLQSFNEACRSSSHFTREMLGSALVTVRLKCVGRGLPEANAMIYKPTAEEHAKCLEFVSRASPARKIAVDEDGDEGEDDLDALVAAIQAEAESDENHLPAPPNDRIIGYASTAGYALVHGRGQAIGACSLSGLAELFVGAEGRKWRNLVLFRNPSGRVARPAFLEIAFN